MMITYTQEELSSIVHAFAFPGTITDWTPHGNGHINDTFLVRSTENGVLRKSILQRMNRTVFHNPTELMQNIAQVTSFLRKKITAAGGDPFRETLNLIPTTDDACFFVDERGEFWRAFLFISDASCYDAVTDPKLFTRPVMLSAASSRCSPIFRPPLFSRRSRISTTHRSATRRFYRRRRRIRKDG